MPSEEQFLRLQIEVQDSASAALSRLLTNLDELDATMRRASGSFQTLFSDLENFKYDKDTFSAPMDKALELYLKDTEKMEQEWAKAKAQEVKDAERAAAERRKIADREYEEFRSNLRKQIDDRIRADEQRENYMQRAEATARKEAESLAKAATKASEDARKASEKEWSALSKNISDNIEATIKRETDFAKAIGQGEAHAAQEAEKAWADFNKNISDSIDRRIKREQEWAQLFAQAESQIASEAAAAAKRTADIQIAEARRAEAEQQKTAEEAARRAQAQSPSPLQSFQAALRRAGFGGGGGINIGNILSGAGDLFGRSFNAATTGINTLFSAAGQTARGFFGVIQSGLGVFSGLGDAIAHATGRMGEFIGVAAGLYTVYEIVHTVKRGFDDLKDSLLDYQDSLVRVSTLTEASTQEIMGMSDAVLVASAQSGKAASDLGSALYFVESHGFRGADAMHILDLSARAAAAGLGEADDIARLVTGKLVAYGAGVEQADHFMNVFIRTIQESGLPAETLSTAFARMTSLAAEAGVGVDELGANIATLTRTGLPAQRAVTDLIAVIQALAKPQKQSIEQFQAWGTSIQAIRQELQDKGLAETLVHIYNLSGGDITGLNRVFPRITSVTDVLATAGSQGEDYIKILDRIKNSAGALDTVYERMQASGRVQLDRLKATLEAIGNAELLDSLNKLAPELRQINDALLEGNFSQVADIIGGGFEQGAELAVRVLDDLANAMFGSGAKIIEALAQGIFEGVNSVLTAAVEYAANLIASVLLGFSFPKVGPLSRGDEGVRRWMTAYADSMQRNASVIGDASTAVAQEVNKQLETIGAADKSGSIESIKTRVEQLDQQMLPIKLAADSIKASYEAQLDPLQAQIDAIKNIKDLEYDRQQLAFKQEDLELRMIKLRAEGDPVKRAQIAGEIARVQFDQQTTAITRERAQIQREMRDLTRNRSISPVERAAQLRELQDRAKILDLRKQENALVNPQLLAEYEKQKALLDVKKEQASIAHDQFELQRQEVLQPILDKQTAIKMQVDEALRLTKEQLAPMQAQRDILQQQLQLLQAQKREASGGAGAGKAAMPPWIPDPADLEKDASNLINQLQTKLGNPGETLAKRFQEGWTKFMNEHGADFGAAFVGALVGGITWGPLGAVIGADFAVQLRRALVERGVTGESVERFATNLVADVKAAIGRISDHLTVGDLIGAADEVAATATTWIANFEKSFFAVWTRTTDDPNGIEGDVVTKRYTGIGRAIVEAITKDVNDEPLDFKDLQKAVGGLIERIRQQIFEPRLIGEMGGELVYAPSLAAGVGESIKQALSPGTVLGAIGGALAFGPLGLVIGGAIGKAVETGLQDAQTRKTMTDAIQLAVNESGKAINVTIELAGKLQVSLTNDLNKAASSEAVHKTSEDIGKAMADAMIAGLTINTGQEQMQKALGVFFANVIVHVAKGMALEFKHQLLLALVGPEATKILEGEYASGPPAQGDTTAYSMIANEPHIQRYVNTAQLDPMRPTGELSAYSAQLLATSVRQTLVGDDRNFFQIGVDAVGGLVNGIVETLANSNVHKEQYWFDHVVTPAKEGTGSNSPSRYFREIGSWAIEGFDLGVQDRIPESIAQISAWARDDILATARDILVGGRTGGGGDPGDPGSANAGGASGLRGIAEQAIGDFAQAFKNVDAATAFTLNAWGTEVVNDIMKPIENPSTGLVARIQRIQREVGNIQIKPQVVQPTPAPVPADNPFPTLPNTPDPGEPDRFVKPMFVAQGIAPVQQPPVQITINATIQGGTTDEVMAQLGDRIHDSVSTALLEAFSMSQGAGTDTPLARTTKGVF